MAQDLDWIWYDTALFAAVAGAEFRLFQTVQGADANHLERDTNMNGSGAFPGQEKFTLKRIFASIDFDVNTALDYISWHINGVAELVVNNQTVFKAPLLVLPAYSQYTGMFTLAVAADQVAIGKAGDGYTFKKPIEIGGGVNFVLRVIQGLAISAGPERIKFCLEGNRNF